MVKAVSFEYGYAR